MPGTRTLSGSHPFWPGHDRVMTDELFRPGFRSAAWVEGQLVPTLHYNFIVGTNLHRRLEGPIISAEVSVVF
jgi:hypothetical protein